MSVWDWMIEYDVEAQLGDDTDRQQLRELLMTATESNESDPDLALAGLAQGRALAERLREPWWILLFDHWRLQVLLHFKGDYHAALDLAVRAALEARKPIYAEFPQRVCLHEDLIYCYVGTDPFGYADAIREALAFMEAEAEPDQECRVCVQECAATFEISLGAWEEAENAARRGLELAESDDFASPHHRFSAHAKLCEIAGLREDWAALPEHVVSGMELGRGLKRPRLLAELLLWQALLARQAGDESRATQLLLRAARTMSRVQALPYEAYFTALCRFHEQGEDFERAASARDHELELLAGKGLHFRTVRAHVERCRYLARLGRLTPTDLDAARAAARQLRNPAAVLVELDQLSS